MRPAAEPAATISAGTQTDFLVRPIGGPPRRPPPVAAPEAAPKAAPAAARPALPPPAAAAGGDGWAAARGAPAAPDPAWRLWDPAEGRYGPTAAAAAVGVEPEPERPPPPGRPASGWVAPEGLGGIVQAPVQAVVVLVTPRPLPRGRPLYWAPARGERFHLQPRCRGLGAAAAVSRLPLNRILTPCTYCVGPAPAE